MFAYIDIRPLIGCGNVLLILFAVGIATFIASSLRRPKLAWSLLGGILVTSIAFWVSMTLFTNVRREQTVDMTWEYGRAEAIYPAAENIVLRFKRDPNQYVGIVSKDLGPYLETLPSREVTVTFNVTRDFGRVRGFMETKIGQRTTWQSSWGYAGSTGNATVSPFDL